MSENEAVVSRIRERFAKRGITMPEINRRQGMVPHGATLLDNPNGTAPGLWIEHGRTAIVLLPGPPREMKPMFEVGDARSARAAIRRRGLFRRVIKITGRTESDVDATVQPVYGRWPSQAVPISTTILAVLGQIELHLTAQRAGPRGGRARARRRGRRTSGGARRGHLQRGRAGTRSRGRSTAARSRAHDRDGGILHRRTAVVAPDGYSGQLRVHAAGRRLLQQRIEDQLAGRSRDINRDAAPSANRWRRPWPRASARRRRRTSASASPASPALAAARRRSRSAPVAIAVSAPGDERVRTFQFFGGRDLVKFQSAQAALNMLRLMLTPAK